MSKKLFAGLKNIAGSLAAGDEVVVNDISAGHIAEVPANHLSSFRAITALGQGTTTLTQAQAGVIVVSNTNTMTLNLPAAASSAGIEYVIIKATSDAFAITLDGNASETINGATTFASIDAQFDTATIVCNGTAWFITSSRIA